jgi:hypothetical protein
MRWGQVLGHEGLALRTIRNCQSTTRAECPRLWDHLVPDESPTVRRCDRCAHLVYLCDTDPETVAHAKAGHCIAREEPKHSELGTVFHGLDALAWGPPTRGQAEARRRRGQEQAINHAIKAVRWSSRDCPGCHYPVPDYRVSCYVCGLEIGRV